MDNTPQINVQSTPIFNVAHSNAQSISAHLLDLRSVAADNNIHVFGISESFLKPGFPSNLVEIPDFTLFRVDRPSIRQGGIAIYVHKSISAKEVCRSSQPERYVPRPEFLFLELTFSGLKILCGTIYSPPKVGFWSDVEESIMSCPGSYDFSFIMGDFNIEWHSNCSTRRTLADSLTCCDLMPLEFLPTQHQDDNTHHTID